MVSEITDMNNVSSLFDKWEETLIWSCLQGIMGKIYADDPNTPTAAMAIIGDFTFFAGKPNIELVSYKPDVISRYAIKKEPHIFDKEKLEKAVASLPKQYTLSMIDERLYQMCKSEEWSADLVSQFPNYENYRKFGIGAVICEGNLIISGASSYSRYREGIEIEIDTREEYRRKGFAYICGAKLILECLKQNLYPSWDAHNKGSVALAEKLGYHYSHTYTAIEIHDY